MIKLLRDGIKGILGRFVNVEVDVSIKKAGNEVETEVGAQAKVNAEAIVRASADKTLQSNIDTKVPYTGAIANVDLGRNELATSQITLNDVAKGIVMPDIGGSGRTARLRLRRIGLDNWQIIVEEMV